MGEVILKTKAYQSWRTVERLEIRQDTEPSHPLDEMPFSMIELFYSDLRKKYPEATDFKYELMSKPYGYGAVDYWYELKILVKCIDDSF